MNLQVYRTLRADSRFTSGVSRSCVVNRKADATRQAAKPAGFVLSFCSRPYFKAGSVVVRTYVEHFREVTQAPGEDDGLALRQVDEPGALHDVAGRKIIFPAAIAASLQREPFACLNIATQLHMLGLLRQLRAQGGVA